MKNVFWTDSEGNRRSARNSSAAEINAVIKRIKSSQALLMEADREKFSVEIDALQSALEKFQGILEEKLKRIYGQTTWLLKSTDEKLSCFTCIYRKSVAASTGAFGHAPQPGETYCEKGIWQDSPLPEMDFCTLYRAEEDSDSLPY